MGAAFDGIQKRQEIRFLDDARAVFTDLDFNEDRNADAGFRKNTLGSFHLTGRVHAEGNRHAVFCKLRNPAQLQIAHDFVGDEDIVDAVLRHDLRLAGFCHGNAARARFQLHLRNLGAFVRFRVRAKRRAVFVCIALHVGKVPQQAGFVDQQRRGVQFGVFHKLASLSTEYIIFYTLSRTEI